MLDRDPRLTDADAATFVASFLHERRSWPRPMDAGVAAVRARTARRRMPDDDDVTTIDVDIPTDHGPRPARAYISRTPSSSRVLFLHGGGWALGDLEMNDALARELARRAHSSIVSLDYRLAPEHPFPAALEDAAAALAWMADTTDLPPGNVLQLAGHSAGGNLAAVLAQWSSMGKVPRVSHQLLLCPVLDSDLSRDSYRSSGHGLLLTTEEMAWYWSMYEPNPDQRQHPDRSPLRIPSARGLPPTTVIVAGADPLRDEGLAYVHLLATSGVRVHLHVEPGVPHLFLTFPPMESRDRALAVAAQALACGT